MYFYKQAAEILKKLLLHEGSIKSLTLADDVREKKKMYAIICETLKCKFCKLSFFKKKNNNNNNNKLNELSHTKYDKIDKNVLNTIIENSEFLKLEKKVCHQ